MQQEISYSQFLKALINISLSSRNSWYLYLWEPLCVSVCRDFIPRSGISKTSFMDKCHSECHSMWIGCYGEKDPKIRGTEKGHDVMRAQELGPPGGSWKHRGKGRLCRTRTHGGHATPEDVQKSCEQTKTASPSLLPSHFHMQGSGGQIKEDTVYP